MARQLSLMARARRAYRAGDFASLVDILGRGDELSRRSAARLLGAMGNRDAVEPLVRALRSSDPLLVNLAMNSLVRLGDHDSREPIYDIVSTTKSAGVRINALSALVDFGDRRAIPWLVPLLGEALPEWLEQPDVFPPSSGRRTRNWAASRLVALNAQEAVPQLQRLCGEASWRQKRRIRKTIDHLRG
jgi:HEAT repeat protein